MFINIRSVKNKKKSSIFVLLEPKKKNKKHLFFNWGAGMPLVTKVTICLPIFS